VFTLGASALAQIPDVQVKGDIGLTYASEVEGPSTLRFYDRFGHLSTVAFQFTLEPGFRAYVSQKLQRLPDDADASQIDESYVEDIGVWRAGKQYLPFGTQNILRESVLAVRSDTEPFFGYLPFQVAACDGGEGRPRGVVGRIGTRLGISFALGTHFAISGTALTQIRDPEDSPGRGFGYRRVLGADYSKSTGLGVAGFEYVVLQEGHNGQPNREVLEAYFTLEPDQSRSVRVSYAQATNPGLSQVTVKGNLHLQNNTYLEPFVRIRDGRFHDAGATLRVRL
jgi:hypothetical protein